ncbi:MAG: hypothetical protein ACLFRL_04275 [Desulfohalobiaceae bacterium]
MENFNPCGIGQHIDCDYDHDNDSEGKTGQIVIVVVVVIAIDTNDIYLTTGRRATGGRPFWEKAVAGDRFFHTKLHSEIAGHEHETCEMRY